MNILLNQSTTFSDSRHLALHSAQDLSFTYPVGQARQSPEIESPPDLLGANDAEERKAVPNERVDRVLAEFGLPVSKALDPETKRSMRSCRENGFEKGRSILAGIGREIMECKRQMDLEVIKGGSQFQVKPLLDQIGSLEKQRDKLDARYGTERFEEMVRMDVDLEELKQENLNILREAQAKQSPNEKPINDQLQIQSQSMHGSGFGQMKHEEPSFVVNSPLAQTEKILTEQDIIKQEERQARQRAMAEKRKRQQDLARNFTFKSPRANASKEKPVQPSANRKMKRTGGSFGPAQSSHSRQVVGTGQSQIELNDGDKEMHEYLEPLIAAAGGNLSDMNDSLKLAPGDDTLNVVGFRLWTALNSSQSWRQREAAAQAFLNYLEAGGAPRFQNQNSLKLFQASMKVALTCCYDKLLQVYFTGLKILTKAMQAPVCGEEILQREVNKELSPFITILLGKVEELNYRVRDVTKESLVSAFKNNHRADEGKLVDAVMEVTQKGPQPDKAPERIILGRLELLLMLLQQLPVKDRPTWDWRHTLQKLACPALQSAHSNVRWMAQQVIAILYQIYGQDTRDIFVQTCQQLEIRSNITDGVLQRLAQIDQNADYSQLNGEIGSQNFNSAQPYAPQQESQEQELPAGHLTRIEEMDETDRLND